MTKKEAIDILRAHVMVACDTSDKVGYGTPLNKMIEEALNMAINALEQQPCEDCVSRAELLRAMDTWDKFGHSYLNMVRLDDDLLEVYVIYVKYEDMVNCVKGLPPVTPTLPKCSTNGEMLKAVFPNADPKEMLGFRAQSYMWDWWGRPYEEKEK